MSEMVMQTTLLERKVEVLCSGNWKSGRVVAMASFIDARGDLVWEVLVGLTKSNDDFMGPIMRVGLAEIRLTATNNKEH